LYSLYCREDRLIYNDRGHPQGVCPLGMYSSSPLDWSQNIVTGSTGQAAGSTGHSPQVHGAEPRPDHQTRPAAHRTKYAMCAAPAACVYFVLLLGSRPHDGRIRIGGVGKQTAASKAYCPDARRYCRYSRRTQRKDSTQFCRRPLRPWLQSCRAEDRRGEERLEWLLAVLARMFIWYVHVWPGRPHTIDVRPHASDTTRPLVIRVISTYVIPDLCFFSAYGGLMIIDRKIQLDLRGVVATRPHTVHIRLFSPGGLSCPFDQLSISFSMFK
jgi:hypothetical protein